MTAEKNPTKKRTPVLIGAGLLLLLCCCLGSLLFRARNGPSVTTTPTAAQEVTNTPEPTQTQPSETTLVGLIPGLEPADVTVNLEQREFTCTEVSKGVIYYETTCTREEPGLYLFHVVISGREPFIVDFIETSVLQYATPDNGIAIPLLGFMATMPYDGATPDEARAWVENTVPTLTGEPGDAQEMVFAGVNYRLFGPPTALTLEMGALP